MKVFVIYDSKYGNTKIVAEKILEGLKQLGGIEAATGYAKEVDPQGLLGYDALIIGAPNHMGKPSRTITKFVSSLSQKFILMQNGLVPLTRIFRGNDILRRR
jgi:menaquinone-dependent protoporphyrinogen IX oxidase